MKKQRMWKFFVLSLGLLGLVSILFGFANPQKRQQVNGWREKQMRAVGEARPPVDQAELVAISERLQKAITVAPLAKTGHTRQSSLREALTRLSSKPIDLAVSLEQARARQAISGNIRMHERNGTPVFIDGGKMPGKTMKVSALAAAPEAALAFIETNRALFRLENPREELRVVETWRDELGKQHAKLTQWYKGIPVWNHDLVMHWEPNGELYAMNARYSPTPREIDLNAPQISATQAIRLAESNLSSRVQIEKFDEWTRQILAYDGPVATRYIWVDPETQKAHLVWHVQIRSNLRDNWQYFVEAQSGRILRHYNATRFDGPATANALDLNNKTQTINVYQIGSTYYMIDASRPIWQTNQPNLLDPRGALVTKDARNKDVGAQSPLFHLTSGNNTWNDRSSVSAHSNVGLVFEYYLNTHQRRAIDGNGSTIISVIHVTERGQPMDNAYWNSVFMAYGDGNIGFKPLAGGLDVAAHEMTHGVIERTVGLDYEFQSGALNESIADIFGAMVDRDDWRIGEDIVKTSYFRSGAMRSLQDPHNGGNSRNDPGWQPAHMSEFQNLPRADDDGGVHVNSGIPNHACYLIANAIGRDKTERIYYRVLAQKYLNGQSQFVDMRRQAIRSATDLYGANSTEVNAVKSAFDAVGITGDTDTKPPGDLPPVQGNQFVAFVNAEATDSSLFLAKPVVTSNADFTQLTTTQVYAQTGNPLSVSDDGRTILFVDSQNFIRAINSDGTDERVISTQGVWSSIALSPNATKIAATTVALDSTIYIFDLVTPSNSKAVRLYHPTTGQDVVSYSTIKADALDWDLTNQFVFFDAFNSIPQGDGGELEFWDISALEVASGTILPILPPLPEGISVGNPSFAQTNNGFLVFDYFDSNQGNDLILAIDLFTGTIGTILNNGTSIAYPKYSTDDSRLVFQRIENNQINLRQVPMAANRIQAAGPSEAYVVEAQLPTWFAVGSRATGSLTVSAPAAGVTWPIGSSQTVTWSSIALTGNVDLKLSTDGGATFSITLAANATNDGSETISVPNNPSTTCRIRVESVANPSVFADNPGNFTIQAACALVWQASLGIRDAGGNSATLSLGQGPSLTNDIDSGACGEQELPPSPPTGVFDARFELPGTPPKGSLKDYRSDSEQLATWRLKFQPGASGAITFSWNPAEFPGGSFFLKDEVTGTLVNVDMKAQNSFSLQAAITSLKIEYSREVAREVSVSSGWNIVSVPLTAANMSVSSLFPDAASPAFEFDNGYRAATTLATGKGYWLKFNSARNYRVSGNPVATREIQVKAGWNMIGAFENDAATSAITSVPAGIVGSQYFGYNNGYSPATTLSPGKGYWVKANQAGVLRLPSSNTPAIIAKASPGDNEVDSAWPKLLIEDQAGNVATLYLAPVSGGSFELPPVPPAGIFDVRFSSGQYVESLAGSREIQISSAQYPIRLTARNLGERVINVKDLLGGNELDATLTEGQAIVVAKALDKIAITANQLPTQFALSQNHPNPFNPQTSIKFALPKRAHVKIAVFNLLGEKVSELVNQEMEAGYHQVQLDARGYASGLYFYVMQAGDFRDLKKMVIAK